MDGKDHVGHRQRLMDKVLAGTCCEHEFLEMFLCFSIPRRNTNDLAHRLLSTFGSLPNLLAASPEQIMSVEGIGKNTAALLCCMGKFCQDYFHKFKGENALPATYEREAFVRYINERYAPLESEVFDVYLLDGNGRIFRNERFESKQGGSVHADGEALTALLAAAKPSGVVLVHNHPYGSPKPSEADDQATKSCLYICGVQNVLLCNHFIYSPEGVYDYYGSGKLAPLTKNHSISRLTKE
ncbi:MAG: hypothetical protein IJX96_00980 [Clostridia bacterium]|nr:hypothetical protein [Clostridia bacterium]